MNHGSRPSLRRVVVFLILLVVLPTAIAGGWMQEVGTRSRLLIQAFFFPVEIVGVLLPAIVLSSGTDRPAVLRWRPARWTWIGLAIVGSLGLGGLLTYAQTLWQDATHLAPPAGLNGLLGIHSWASGILLVLGAAIVPAICEETAFRGLVMSGLERWGGRVAVVVTTLLFAAYHFEPYGIPTYLVLGAFLAWLAWRSGSILPGIAAHATNNLLALGQVNGTGDAWWWAHVWTIAPTAAALAIVAIAWLHRTLPRIESH